MALKSRVSPRLSVAVAHESGGNRDYWTFTKSNQCCGMWIRIRLRIRDRLITVRKKLFHIAYIPVPVWTLPVNEKEEKSEWEDGCNGWGDEAEPNVVAAGARRVPLVTDPLAAGVTHPAPTRSDQPESSYRCSNTICRYNDHYIKFGTSIYKDVLIV
jgi:hypothetical protein